MADKSTYHPAFPDSVASTTPFFVVLGAGESGIGAALLAAQRGYRVLVSDAGPISQKARQELAEAGIEFEESGHSESRILAADEVMKSPGIPETNVLVQKIRSKGIPVISEIELAYRFKGDSRIIAITGTNGKTTTTALTYHICKQGGANCALVGNIGYSFARQVALAPKALYVVEVSSFQLDDIDTFRPNVAVLTNITADHLDRYEYRMEHYVKSKFRITKNQGPDDVFIYCMDDPETQAHISNYPIQSILYPITMTKIIPNGAYISNQQLHMKWKSEEVQMNIRDFALKGKHNQYNSMAAGAACMAEDIKKDAIRESLKNFRGLEHRMEVVATIRGVEFINDSKSTNINSTWFALESMEKPTILILGGIDKGNDYGILRELAGEKVKAVVCLGADNQKIIDAFSHSVPLVVSTSSASEAVQTAFRLATKGDAVLLSPACASFDLFKNYEDRGNQFRKAVIEL
jgi:UDP-N-acetylmuramoylalanine--D-glutamate ligase